MGGFNQGEAVFRVRPDLAGIETFRTRMGAALRGVSVQTAKLAQDAARVRLQFSQGLINRTKLRQSTAELALARAQLRRIGQETRGVRTALTGTITKLVALAGGALIVRRLARALSSAAKEGINLNAQFEAMQVGVAATLAAGSKIVDVFGKQLTGINAVLAAQTRSRDVMQKIFSITLETGATLDVTLQAFRVALPLVLRLGGSLDDTLNIVKRLNLAAIAIGIDITLVRQQIDDLLKGIVTQRTLLALVLGITQQQLRVERERGTILEFLVKKTQAFIDAQDILLGKFAAVSNRAIALGQILKIKVTEGGFNLIRNVLKDIVNTFAIFDKKTREFKGFRPEVLEAVKSLRKAFTETVRVILAGIPFIIKGFGSVAEIIGLTIRGASKLTEAFRGLIAAGAQARAVAAEMALQQQRALLDSERARGADTRLREKTIQGLEAEAVQFRAVADAQLDNIIQGKKFREEIKNLISRLSQASTSAAGLFEKAIGPQLKKFTDDFGKVLDPKEARKRAQETFKPIGDGIQELSKLVNKGATEAADALRTKLFARIVEIGTKLPEQVRVLFGQLVQAQFQVSFEAIKAQTEGQRTALKRLEAQFKKLGEQIRSLPKELRFKAFLERGPEFLGVFKVEAIRLREIFEDINQTLAVRVRAADKLLKVERRIADAIKEGARAQKKALEDLEKLGIKFFSEKLLKDIEETRKEILSKLTLEGDAQKRLDDIAEQVRASFRSLAEDIGQAFSRIFANILSQTKGFVASMRDILRSIVNAIIGTFISRLVTAAIEAALSPLRKKIEDILTKKKGKEGPLEKIVRIIFGIPKESKDQKEALDKSTKTIDETKDKITETNILLGQLIGVLQIPRPVPPGQNFFGGGFGLPFAATAGQGGGGQQGGGIFAGGNPFSKQNRAATAALAAAGISQIIFAKSKAQKVGGALLTAAAFDPEPISKTILAIAGTLTSAFGALFDTGARREAKRQKRVQAAIERQLITLPSGKVFRFADAASIQGIFGSTTLELPGGRFRSVPQEPGFSTGGNVTISPVFQISARTADDAEEIKRVMINEVLPEVKFMVRRELDGRVFRSARLASEIRETITPA